MDTLGVGLLSSVERLSLPRRLPTSHTPQLWVTFEGCGLHEAESNLSFGGMFCPLHALSRDRRLSVSRMLKMYYYYGKVNRGRPYLRESVMGGSTVCMHVYCVEYYVHCVMQCCIMWSGIFVFCITVEPPNNRCIGGTILVLCCQRC